MQAAASSPALPVREVDRHLHPASLHAALAAGLDRLAHGVAIFDTSGHALFANASARALWLRLGWSASSIGRGQQGQDWRAALQRVCLRGRRELVNLPLPGTTLAVALSPLGPQADGLAFAIFGRDEICGSVELEMFALRHKLTLAETQVLRHLCHGLQAGDIARANAVARTTVLTQIASIRAKTESASIRNLLAALARMPQLVPSVPVFH